MAVEEKVKISFWCERVRSCFKMFLKNPATLQHLLLFGPPGSGKTTSASWLVSQIWKTRKSLMCISMNAADERSLESIRQKVFPFLRVDWRTEDETAPRFLILDECETLTEAAQLSLQTILNNDPKNMCVILICNSQSRIHPKLRQRLLKIRYDPPNRNDEIVDLGTAITRGDLRQNFKKADIEKRIWKYIQCHPTDIFTIITDETIDYQMIISEIMLLADIFELIDNDLLYKINIIYPLITDNTIMYTDIQQLLIELISEFKIKFEIKFGA
jgi:DNA polymerase III delta prime subunit